MQAHKPKEQKTSEINLELPCKNLRSKEMYYQSYGSVDDEFSSGIYWCGRTQENFGPDGEACGKSECCAKRTCFIS